MEGKTGAQRCVVTGANRGLGLEFCRQLLAGGARVIAACRQSGKATALNTLAGEYPGRLHVVPLDVAEPKSHAALTRELPLLTEGQPLDLLINNAGVLRGGERYGSVQAADLETSFRTPALGPFLLVQTLTPQLADACPEHGRRGARVANISEIGSIGLRQEFRTPSYAIGKAGQNMATSLLAQALAPRGIVVVALHPGWVRTDMGTERAALSPQESVRGLLQVIGGLQARDSRAFLDWQGQTLPWQGIGARPRNLFPLERITTTDQQAGRVSSFVRKRSGHARRDRASLSDAVTRRTPERTDGHHLDRFIFN